ncbi:hypothetical protein XFF6992_300072 [Xanthomonas citri pv. fuscans]|nr:hypothetical protein XFF6990_200363 [Xanthomonas citri pv. fuscans]SOO03719.1 hypothetical protein XFF6960_890035 [Xanthomonas citri pv. fuscans]SOO04967.1 hypothetical protein XFF7767_340035 [Xanthomonas citri pv. fuscans]SOO11560.1 hypothetical protein XFF6970_90028 [Xanthomonas citri pv. fuscans]SOO19184.1 hypothetical protein XFF6992_300072 [Xanthomonas citri pv. fuscans]
MVRILTDEPCRQPIGHARQCNAIDSLQARLRISAQPAARFCVSLITKRRERRRYQEFAIPNP